MQYVATVQFCVILFTATTLKIVRSFLCRHKYTSEGDSENLVVLGTTIFVGIIWERGSKVSVIFSDDSIQLHEISAGGGYLSQSAPVVFIGEGNSERKVENIKIRWPDGFIKEFKVDEFRTQDSFSSSYIDLK